MLIVYLIWITIGTAFYAAGSMDLGFCKGYYMCVNVGYSIGWGYPVETLDSEFFFRHLSCCRWCLSRWYCS